MCFFSERESPPVQHRQNFFSFRNSVSSCSGKTPSREVPPVVSVANVIVFIWFPYNDSSTVIAHVEVVEIYVYVSLICRDVSASPQNTPGSYETSAASGLSRWLMMQKLYNSSSELCKQNLKVVNLTITVLLAVRFIYKTKWLVNKKTQIINVVLIWLRSICLK